MKTIEVRRNDGMVLWSHKEMAFIDGLYSRDGDEHESMEDWV